MFMRMMPAFTVGMFMVVSALMLMIMSMSMTVVVCPGVIMFVFMPVRMFMVFITIVIMTWAVNFKPFTVAASAYFAHIFLNYIF